MGPELPLVTLTIVIATSAVTIAAFKNFSLHERFILHVGAIEERGEWYRLFTSALLHGDWMHLLVNMFSLFAFGSLLEHVIAPWRFAMVYVTGVMIASFVAVILHRHEWNYRALGASGGVAAVVGAATAAFPDMTMMVFPVPIPLPAWIVGTAFIVYSVIGARGRWDNVGHDAHLAGTLTGMGMLAAFYPAAALENIVPIGVMLAAGGAAWLYVRRR